MNINLTPIIQAIIALLAALITYKLIPWIKSKTTEQQQCNLQALVRVLVYAAEQIYGAGNGPEKLEYVCEEMRKRGFEVDLSEIEAMVYKELNFAFPILRSSCDTEPGDGQAQHGDAAANEQTGKETEENASAEKDEPVTGEAETGVQNNAPPDAAAESRE